jgi:hypothetical protein
LYFLPNPVPKLADEGNPVCFVVRQLAKSPEKKAQFGGSTFSVHESDRKDQTSEPALKWSRQSLPSIG